MTDEHLRTAVEQQARAHVAGDAASFASWMTPGAVVELGRTAELTRGITPKRFTVIDITTNGAGGTSSVRYDGAGGYVIDERWELDAGGWKAVAAERPVRSIRRPWWRRLFSRTTPTPARRDLS